MNIKIYISLVMCISTISLQAQSIADECNSPSSSLDLNINNVRARLLNGGDMFWDIFESGKARYEIPKNSGRHSSFAAALWLSAVDVNNNLHTAAQTYRQRGLEYWPGPLNAMGEAVEIDCTDWDEIFSVYGTEVNNVRSGKNISYNISRWPSTKAPFYDKNSDGIYDPSFGDYPVLDIEHPTIIPGQLAYWVFNDKGGIHNVYPGAEPIGVEVEAFAYAYTSSSSDAINNSTLYRYIITNKSNINYSEFRMGKFVDFDLGGPDDDYVGCDLSTNIDGKKRNLFFTYNSDNDDESGSALGYGIAPPAFGISFLNPGKKSDGSALNMHSFMFFTNQGTTGIGIQNDAVMVQRYLSGLWSDGSPLTYGTPDGRGGTDPAKFAFPGNTDPQGRPNWVETAVSGDRRGKVAIEPRTLTPGERMVIDFAFIWARDTPGTNITSLNKLRLTTDTLIAEYQTQFSGFSTGIAYQKNKINVYPNPSSSYLIVDGMDRMYDVKIYNSEGKLMKHLSKPISNKIDIEDLAQGVYYLNVDQYTHKFIKR